MVGDKTLTHSVDEIPLETVFGGDSIYSIPYFQRYYIWGNKQLKELISDIRQILDEVQNSLFLGAIILYSRTVPVGRSNLYEVVDGQQRITTIYLFLIALADMYCSLNKWDEAASLVSKFLLLGPKSKEISNIKFYPCKQDRVQINYLFKNLLGKDKLNTELGNPSMRYLQEIGSPRGKITTQYKEIKRFLEQEKTEGGFERLDSIYTALLRNFTIVQILLKDPTSCPLIFERLNYRGMKVTTGDLVRNEIFSRTIEKPLSEVETIYSSEWEPFYNKFGGADSFEKYFFPYGLIEKPTVTKSNVFSVLRTKWQKESSPQVIIKELAKYQGAFLDITKNQNNCDLKKEVKGKLVNLYRANIPSSTYPFLIKLIYESSNNAIDPKESEHILILLDSFLTRRAICGHDPTGLHAVFKNLWQNCEGSPTFDKVKYRIKSYKTVPWPSDDEFRAAIMIRKLYGSGIVSYFICEYDRSWGKDCPSDKPEIEHVLPQTLTPDWKKVFSNKEHDAYKDTLANLIPLSAPLNKNVRQKPYAEKRRIYADDSMFATPRELARKYEVWNVETLKDRSKIISDWAVTRWPY